MDTSLKLLESNAKMEQVDGIKSAMLAGSEMTDSVTGFLLRAYDPPTYTNPTCALLAQGRFHHLRINSLRGTSTGGVTMNIFLP